MNKLVKTKRRLFTLVIFILIAMFSITAFAYSYTTVENEKTLRIESAFFRVNAIEAAQLDVMLTDTYYSYFSEIYSKTDASVAYMRIEDKNGRLLAQTENAIVIELVNSNRGYDYGVLSFEDFRQSFSDKNYFEACDYLKRKPDKNGEYFELLCTKYRFDDEGIVYPEEVQIVKTSEINSWYIQDEVVKSYRLSPTLSDTVRDLEKIGEMRRNEISTQFVLGELIDEEAIEQIKVMLDTYKEKQPLYKKSAFEYYVVEKNRIYQIDDRGRLIFNRFHYCEKIDLISLCISRLIIGNLIILASYFVVGIFMLSSVWYIFKRAFNSEQMRVEMTNALAHNLKNPLFVISGVSENIKELPQNSSEYADTIMSQAARMNSLVQQMLNMSKLSSGKYKLKREDIELNALVGEIAKSANGGADIKITADEKVFINADKQLLQLALENIVDNAVKYTTDGKVKIIINSNSLTVSNACERMKKSELKRVWKKYQRLENDNKYGTGLGLWIVASVLKLHKFKYKAELSNNIFSIKIKF